MLIRFVVSNFLSFKEETEFNMLTNKGNGYSKHTNHIYNSPSNVPILKLAAIYGANASGKSNLVNAIEYLKNLVIGEITDSLIPISKRFRIEEKYKKLPTTFRIEFTHKEDHFDYGIEIFKGKIIEEWLYKIENVKKNKETLLFQRKKNAVTFGSYFSEKNVSYLERFLEMELKENQTVLNASYGRIENNDILDIAFNKFNHLTIISPDSLNPHYSSSLATGNQSHNFVSKLLSNAKTGIEKIVSVEVDSNTFFSYDDEDFKQEIIERLEEGIESDDTHNEEDVTLSFYHNNQHYSFQKKDDQYFVSFLKTKHYSSNELFEFNEESDGTNRLFELAPVFDFLVNGNHGIFIIDELERSMHPILVKELINLYSKTDTKNNQLIFTTHESQLLDLNLFRQDEIWFAEKKQNGSSEFYPLSKFKPREDKNIKKGYLQGRYGGVPFLGDFSKLTPETYE